MRRKRTKKSIIDELTDAEAERYLRFRMSDAVYQMLEVSSLPEHLDRLRKERAAHEQRFGYEHFRELETKARD
jgi:hypothetical protein